jgi:hypothetical protein
VSPAKNAPFEQGSLTRLAKPGAKKLPELAHASDVPIQDFEVGVAATLPLKQFNHVVNEDEDGCRSVELAHVQNCPFSAAGTVTLASSTFEPFRQWQ